MLSHHKNGLNSLLYSEIERKEDQEDHLFLYDDTDRNVRNTIFDSPFTIKEKKL